MRLPGVGVDGTPAALTLVVPITVNTSAKEKGGSKEADNGCNYDRQSYAVGHVVNVLRERRKNAGGVANGSTFLPRLCLVVRILEVYRQ